MICLPQNKTGVPMKLRNFCAEFKRESAQQVLNQNYTVIPLQQRNSLTCALFIEAAGR